MKPEVRSPTNNPKPNVEPAKKGLGESPKLLERMRDWMKYLDDVDGMFSAPPVDPIDLMMMGADPCDVLDVLTI